ncbi:MAG: hypothetical protein AAB902_02160 [Patescibacteria group bacterium]
MEEKEEFEGELNYIDPSRLIKEDKVEKFNDFFLTLAVVFNDLKDLDFFEQLVIGKYRKPPFEERTVHSGEFGGILTHTRKIFISNLREFFEFLKENKEIIYSAEFKDVLSKTNRDIEQRWNNIVDIALNNETTNIKDFTQYLIEVRNNAAFHYYQPGGLRKAFCNFFYKKDKIKQNELAYYYIGENTATTRFFYADAAVQEYLRSTGKENAHEFNYKYNKEIGSILGDITITILRLLKAYLKNRPK